mmetsp:Transcript_7880/g.20601  ORF Transcript_7880/g.20601 Transcript_7880/m.20601 type:complete len:230 (-) Transcript_7880:720-1409(-)
MHTVDSDECDPHCRRLCRRRLRQSHAEAMGWLPVRRSLLHYTRPQPRSYSSRTQPLGALHHAYASQGRRSRAASHRPTESPAAARARRCAHRLPAASVPRRAAHQPHRAHIGQLRVASSSRAARLAAPPAPSCHRATKRAALCTAAGTCGAFRLLSRVGSLPGHRLASRLSLVADLHTLWSARSRALRPSLRAHGGRATRRHSRGRSRCRRRGAGGRPRWDGGRHARDI